MNAADWRRLAERAGHVFATREWLLTWWRHYGKRPPAARGRAGRRRAGGDRAAASCGSGRHSGAAVRRAWPERPTRPVCAPRRPGGGRRGDRPRGAVPLRRFVLLAEQVAGDHRFGELTGARPLYREASPVLRFEHDSWDEFLRARGRNFRQQVRRFPRKLSELGTVSYRLATIPSVSTATSTFCSIFTASAGRSGDAVPPGAVSSRVRRAGARAGVAAAVVPRDRRQAGCRALRFPVRRRRVGLPGRKGPCLREQPVGFVLLLHAVREALTDGMGEYRLLRGGAAYKERFATSDPGLETFGLPRGARRSSCSPPPGPPEGDRSAYGGSSTGCRAHSCACGRAGFPTRSSLRHVSLTTARRDERVRADPKTSQDERSRADRGAALDVRALDLPARFGDHLVHAGTARVQLSHSGLTRRPRSADTAHRWQAHAPWSNATLRRSRRPLQSDGGTAGVSRIWFFATVRVRAPHHGGRPGERAPPTIGPPRAPETALRTPARNTRPAEGHRRNRH